MASITRGTTRRPARSTWGRSAITGCSATSSFPQGRPLAWPPILAFVLVVAAAQAIGAWMPNALVQSYVMELVLLAAALLLGDGHYGLGLRPIQRPWLTGTIVLGPFLAIAALKAILLLDPARTWADVWSLPPFRPAILFLMVVLAPIAEEATFRGWLWEALDRRFPAWIVALATTALFLAVHPIQLSAMPLAIIPAFATMTVIRLAGGSLLPCVAFHMLWNLSSYMAGGGIPL